MSEIRVPVLMVGGGTVPPPDDPKKYTPSAVPCSDAIPAEPGALLDTVAAGACDDR